MIPKMDPKQRNEVFFKLADKAIELAIKTREAKNDGYNNCEYVGSYFPHGVQDLAYEIQKKIMRIESCIRSEQEGKDYGESITDSVAGIINYASYIYAYRMPINQKDAFWGKAILKTIAAKPLSFDGLRQLTGLGRIYLQHLLNGMVENGYIACEGKGSMLRYRKSSTCDTDGCAEISVSGECPTAAPQENGGQPACICDDIVRMYCKEDRNGCGKPPCDEPCTEYDRVGKCPEDCTYFRGRYLTLQNES
jgi:hypothetical protein